MLARRPSCAWALLLGLAVAAGCQKTTSEVDGGPSPERADAGDAGADAGEPDASAPDAATPDAGGDECAWLPDGAVMLPKDDARHNEDIEWWYWTGHLKAADAGWYGFEETVFFVQVNGYSAQIVHVAVTDVDAGTFHHLQSEVFGSPVTPADGGFQLQVGEQRARGVNGRDVLHGQVDGYTLDLELTSTKAPTLQHGSGYKDYPFGGYTYYYSRQRMAAQGTLALDAGVFPVEGSVWFDHQWGSLTQATQLGWDWFALQLDDGRDIMLMQVRAGGSMALETGTLSDSRCHPTELLPGDFTITAKGQWTNGNGCAYPSGWDIVVKGQHFTVTPVMPDQELATALKRYWEGAALVSGDAPGRAYVELTGYCN